MHLTPPGLGRRRRGSIASLGLLLLIPVAMYFLMIRPQRRRMREQQAMQSELEVGDEVITTSAASTASSLASTRIGSGSRSTTTCRSASAAAAIQGKVDTSGFSS